MKPRGRVLHSPKQTAAAATRGVVYHVQVLDRALAILDLLSGDDSELGVAQIAERLHLHKSTVHRLLAVLERHQYVEKNPESGKHGLGAKVLEMGWRAMARQESWERARPFLERLVMETGETAHLGVLRGGEILSLVNVDSSRSLRMPSTVGRRSPAHCTSLGKSILAFLTEEQVAEILLRHGMKAFTRKTISSPASLKSELERVRRQGYAIDDEEVEEALKCIGAPVRDHSGKVVAAISIAGPAARMKQDVMPGLVRSVVTAAVELSSELGFHERSLDAGAVPGRSAGIGS